MALARVLRRDGEWDQSVAYFEEALALDPRNMELLMDVAYTYIMLRQFPAALKLYDRALDITPDDPHVMATKAGIYQAQGNLQEAARLLSGINWQTPSWISFGIKIFQLQLERNYGEAVRLLQTRQAQFHFDSEYDKAFNAAPCWGNVWRKGYCCTGARCTRTARSIRQRRGESYNRIAKAGSAPARSAACSVAVSSLCRDGREGLGSKGRGACNYACAQC